MDAGSSVTRSPRVSLPSPVPPSITREALATPHQVTFLVLCQHFPKVASGLGCAILSQSLGLYFFCTNHLLRAQQSIPQLCLTDRVGLGQSSGSVLRAPFLSAQGAPHP